MFWTNLKYSLFQVVNEEVVEYSSTPTATATVVQAQPAATNLSHHHVTVTKNLVPSKVVGLKSVVQSSNPIPATLLPKQPHPPSAVLHQQSKGNNSIIIVKSCQTWNDPKVFKIWNFCWKFVTYCPTWSDWNLWNLTFWLKICHILSDVKWPKSSTFEICVQNSSLHYLEDKKGMLWGGAQSVVYENQEVSDQYSYTLVTCHQ